ncbi:MAG: flagellar hook-basal body complex protein [Rhodospirillaceae bacterium]|nr:MAG: flagellar hook-basal body complex protein [Rhodospirillaceae bacterium]
MSLFGALYSGVSGLQSQSSAMGAISDNITNVNTVGYKNTELNFKTLVTAQTSSTTYSPGGVLGAPHQSVDLQGLLQATTSSTDMAVSGQGLFVTNSAANPGINQEFTYTRAGSFTTDQNGFLKNAGGAYIEGWPLTTFTGAANASTINVNGNTFMRAYTNGLGQQVLINDNIVNNVNLQPLNLQNIGGTAQATTTLNIGANLPAADAVGAQEQVNGQIFDSLGNAQNLNLVYTKTAANTWSSAIEPPAGSAVVDQLTQNGAVYQAGGRIDLAPNATGAVVGTINMSANGQAFSIILDPNNPDTVGPFGIASSPLTVGTNGKTMNQIIDQIAKEMDGVLSDTNVFGTPPASIGNWARAPAGENGLVFTQADNVNSMTFTVNVTDANNTQLAVQSAAAGYTVPPLDATYGALNLVLGPPNTATVLNSAIAFNGQGTPTTIFGLSASQAPDPHSKIEVTWANGASPMVSGSTTSPAILLSQGDYNTPDGITQLAGDFQLNFLQQNGAKFGSFAGVSIATDGVVTATFNNGVTVPIFQIPLATFTNPDGLSSLSGNVYIATSQSGNPVLQQAGTATAGTINASSLEQSTVDLGTEFTRMITTQRAYSSAAKVITTANSMLDDLLNAVR